MLDALSTNLLAQIKPPSSNSSYSPAASMTSQWGHLRGRPQLCRSTLQRAELVCPSGFRFSARREKREKERGSGHTSSPQLHSTVCIEPFISLLGSVPGLKGSYRSSLCYWCQCQRIWKDAEQVAQCYLFKYRRRRAQSDYKAEKVCQCRSRTFLSRLVNFSGRNRWSLAKSYNYVDNRVCFSKWQLKANTEHLNLRTGAVWQSRTAAGVKVSGEIAAWKLLPEGHQSWHEL